LRGRKESGSEEDDRGRRERTSEEKDGEEGERGVVRRRRERGSEEVDGEESSFLSVILTTSPSFIPLNPPPHYLSSLSCNIIIHLITSVFLPSSWTK
jgi:hypothetical protein